MNTVRNPGWRLAIDAMLAVVVAGMLLLARCQRTAISEQEAEQAAKERFVKVCRDFRYDEQSFTGPSRSGIGGSGFAYEWHTKTVGNDFGILITVDTKGVTNVSFLGHIPGVKYLK